MPVSTSMRALILERHSARFTAAVDHGPLLGWQHTLRERADCRIHGSASRGNFQRRLASRAMHPEDRLRFRNEILDSLERGVAHLNASRV
jgi:hypothetical protein